MKRYARRERAAERKAEEESCYQDSPEPDSPPAVRPVAAESSGKPATIARKTALAKRVRLPCCYSALNKYLLMVYSRKFHRRPQTLVEKGKMTPRRE